jgi:hypothetical protein
LILLTEAADVIGKEVKHKGQRVGIVTSVKPNMDKGRRYALVKPHDAADAERRIPLDELDLVGG